MKNTPVKIKRQYPKYVYLKVNRRILTQQEIFLEEECTKSTIELLKAITFFAEMYPEIYPSQATLAKYVGIQRETANKLFKKLVELGLVKKIYRRKTWVIALSAWLRTEKGKAMLQRLFMIGMAALPLNAYISDNAMSSYADINPVTLTSSILNDKNIYIKKEEEKRPEKYMKASPKPKIKDIEHFKYLYHQCTPLEKKQILAMLPEDDPLLSHLLENSSIPLQEEEKEIVSDNPFSCI